MLIERKVHNRLIETCIPVPPETGGIIGGRNNIISIFEFDKLSDNISNNSYKPNTVYLNEVINLWEKNNIEFYGVFHSHYSGGNVLSVPDKEYILRIMKAVPLTISKLYFPLIFPKESMLAYIAVRKGNEVHIEKDTVIMVDT